MARTLLIHLSLAGVLLAFAGCAGSAPNQLAGEIPADATVTMGFHAFSPPSITIEVGQTVEWQNHSLAFHTVTANATLARNPDHVLLPEGALPFNSGDILPNGTYRHRFTVPGAYRYVCLPHEDEGMVAHVIVRAAPASASSPAPASQP